MTGITLAAHSTAPSAGSTVPTAQPGPDFGKPFGDRSYYGAPYQTNNVAAERVASDADARARLEAEGFQIIELVRGGDGVWLGSAIRRAARVNVVITPDGGISAD